MSSTPFQPDLLSLISCDSCAEGATSVSGHAEPVSGHKKVQYKSLTVKQLLAAQKEARERYGFAKEGYLSSSRYEKSSFRQEMRNAGQEIERIENEMEKRGIKHNPTGRPSGKKGDARI